jgi:hypothetical protein
MPVHCAFHQAAAHRIIVNVISHGGDIETLSCAEFNRAERADQDRVARTKWPALEQSWGTATLCPSHPPKLPERINSYVCCPRNSSRVASVSSRCPRRSTRSLRTHPLWLLRSQVGRIIIALWWVFQFAPFLHLGGVSRFTRSGLGLIFLFRFCLS